jgi:hypothetical protein
MSVFDSSSTLLQPDIVLPQQYMSVRTAGLRSPERRLMLAVLEEAVLTVVKHRGDPRGGPRRLVREATQWVVERNSPWPFAFENICAALQLDAGYMRRGLLALLAEPIEARPRTRSVLPFARRVAGQRHKVGLILPHRKAAS